MKRGLSFGFVSLIVVFVLAIFLVSGFSFKTFTGKITGNAVSAAPINIYCFDRTTNDKTIPLGSCVQPQGVDISCERFGEDYTSCWYDSTYNEIYISECIYVTTGWDKKKIDPFAGDFEWGDEGYMWIPKMNPPVSAVEKSCVEISPGVVGFFNDCFKLGGTCPSVLPTTYSSIPDGDEFCKATLKNQNAN